MVPYSERTAANMRDAYPGAHVTFSVTLPAGWNGTHPFVSFAHGPYISYHSLHEIPRYLWLIHPSIQVLLLARRSRTAWTRTLVCRPWRLRPLRPPSLLRSVH
jgi:hypothetical protein